MVVGAGQTGVSCARYLHKQGRHFVLMDSRETPPGSESLREEFGDATLVFGQLDLSVLLSADEIWLSPGVALATPEIAQAVEQGVHVRGDIDVFAEQAKAPIVAITGSNGKSTVTTLVGEMAKQNGTRVAVGGNLGVPALDLLDDSVELYVLELSSFQLETTHRLNAEAAALLNISEDHMDRYPSKMAYLQAKQRIFPGAKKVIVNDDEPLSQPLAREGMQIIHYGLSGQDLNKFGVSEAEGKQYLVRSFDQLIALDEVALKGRHNISNALAALALGSAVGLRMEAMLTALRRFGGLPHRCQSVRSVNGVHYINDSKGTNTGATVVAINSFGEQAEGQVVLLAGGEAKGADLAPLKAPMQKHGKAALVYGRDKALLTEALEPVVRTESVDTLHDAVQRAQAIAERGDIVLFSPACASFDMFDNFQQRGDVFCAEVMKL